MKYEMMGTKMNMCGNNSSISLFKGNTEAHGNWE